MTIARLATGKKGEEEAQKELERQGYRVLIRNYRCRTGEIDIIAEKDGVLVFVEVKTRTSLDFGLPQESVNFKKQARIRKVAQVFLAETKQFYRDISFCVVGVQLDKTGMPKEVEIIDNAF